jgi:tetratricopeptide (TPR) repeat protein
MILTYKTQCQGILYRKQWIVFILILIFNYAQGTEPLSMQKIKNTEVFYMNLGKDFYDACEYEKALKYYNKALSLNYQDKELKIEIYYRLAEVYLAKRDYSNYILIYKKLAKILEQQNAPREELSKIDNFIGVGYYEKGEYKKALEFLNKALGKQTKTKTLTLSYIYTNKGLVYMNFGQYDKAMENFLMALKIQENILPSMHTAIISNYINLGDSYGKQEKLDKALKHYQKAYGASVELFGRSAIFTLNVSNRIAHVYRKKKQYEKAMEIYAFVLNTISEKSIQQHPVQSTAMSGIGKIWTERKKYTKALEYYLKATAIKKVFLGEGHPSLAKNYILLGDTYGELKAYDKVVDYYQKALSLLDRKSSQYTQIQNKITSLQNTMKSKK